MLVIVGASGVIPCEAPYEPPHVPLKVIAFEVLFNKLEVSVSAYKLEKENTVNIIKNLEKKFFILAIYINLLKKIN